MSRDKLRYVSWVEWLKKDDISLKVLGFAPNQIAQPNLLELGGEFTPPPTPQIRPVLGVLWLVEGEGVRGVSENLFD